MTTGTMRRKFLGMLGVGGALAFFGGRGTATAKQPKRVSLSALGAIGASSTAPVDGVFTLPPLPYDYNALEPYIDEETMHFHHDAHHKDYVDKINAALAPYPDWKNREIADILYHINDVPEAIRTTIRNSGGGHLNHSIFWATMAPNAGGAPTGTLASAISGTFGSFDAFKAQLSGAAANRFGSGWGWLVLDGDKKLMVVDRPNQDSPVMDGLAPLLGVDVWEHSYYLRYRNRRADYLKEWWNTVNWDAVQQRYTQSIG